MENKYKKILKERLKIYIDWKNQMDEYFFHIELSEKTKKKYYSKKKFLNILFLIYFFPINTFNYLQKIRENHIYNKGIIAIEVIKNEIEKNNNNQKEKNE
tara:strand:+ start:155 stop:454 length:300 start_codon:yes stop_codon:yes gene_type:complete